MLKKCLVSRYFGCRVKLKRMIPFLFSAISVPSIDYSVLESQFNTQSPPPIIQPQLQPQLQLLPEAINLVKHFEGLKLKRYYCPSGKLTIGYGHTGIGTRNISISVSQAEALLEQDLAVFQNIVKQNVKVPLTNSQFGALVSFSFNVGPNAFTKSTLLKKLNQRDYSSAAQEFLKWNKDNRKRILPGLVKRRQAEVQLFWSTS